jgi:peptidyl-tRNA hydrolase, PTH1 family
MTDQVIDPHPIKPITRQGPYLIAGLGNPGRKYEHNRHNVGFMLLNRLATKFGENFSQVQSRALITKTTVNSEKVILIKPQAYMNQSGSIVGSLIHFYQVPFENILVAYDDVDLPLGTLRIRPSGGSAGQKGMQSIIERLGTEEFPRLRIGTSRPPGKKEAAEYVLQNFRPEELDLLNEALDRAVEAVLSFLEYGIDRTMNSFNG